jgi:peroxiredoxin
MSPRFWVLAGLLSGVITGLAILAIAVAYGPEPGIARVTVPPSPGPIASVPAATAGGPATAGPSSAATPGLIGVPSAQPTLTVLHVGAPAPVLVVPQVGGGMIDLAALRGRPVWLVFVATSCSACAQELSLMNGYAARYGSNGLVVLAIDVREEEGAVSNFANRVGATFPFGLDVEGGAQRDWEVVSLPTHFWVGADGVVQDAAQGAIGSERMAGGLRKILPGVDVRP